MTEQNIIAFKESIADFSLEQLQSLKTELNDSLAKMIMDSDLVMKIALLDAALAQKENA